MPESRLPQRSFGAIRIDAPSVVAWERSTAMYDGMYQVIWDEHERRVAWVNEHAWKFEQMHASRRSFRAIVANAVRTVAERIAPAEVDVEPAMQR
jgi:hypothetical protein